MREVNDAVPAKLKTTFVFGNCGTNLVQNESERSDFLLMYCFSLRIAFTA